MNLREERGKQIAETGKVFKRKQTEWNAVDPHTGDVFRATSECDEVKNKRLERLQAQVRAKLHLSQSQYQRLKTKGPLCEE